jgi:hypothetical protein
VAAGVERAPQGDALATGKESRGDGAAWWRWRTFGPAWRSLKKPIGPAPTAPLIRSRTWWRPSSRSRALRWRSIRPLFPKGWRYETQLVALPIFLLPERRSGAGWAGADRLWLAVRRAPHRQARIKAG